MKYIQQSIDDNYNFIVEKILNKKAYLDIYCQ